MIINRKDWLRGLKIAASVGEAAVKFSADGSFGILSGSSFLVFGKSLPLGKEIAFMDMGEVIKALGCFRQQEINIEISEGKITFAGDNDKICHCRLAPLELVPNLKFEETRIPLYPGEWLNVLLQVEELYHLRDAIKATRAFYVWFVTRDGRLTALVKGGQILWEIVWEELNLPKSIGFWAGSLLRCLNCLDASHISLAFKFTDSGGILHIGQKDSYSGTEFNWYLAAVTEEYNEKRQTQGNPRLLLPPKE